MAEVCPLNGSNDHQPQIVRIGREQLGDRWSNCLAVRGSCRSVNSTRVSLGCLAPRRGLVGLLNSTSWLPLMKSPSGPLVAAFCFSQDSAASCRGSRVGDQGLANEFLDAGLLLRGEGAACSVGVPRVAGYQGGQRVRVRSPRHLQFLASARARPALCQLSSKSALSSRGERISSAGRPVDLVEGNGGAALAQEDGDSIASAGPIAAKGHHARGGRSGARCTVVTQQHVVFVGLAGDAPVGGDIHETRLFWARASAYGLLRERLPGDAIDAGHSFHREGAPAAGPPPMSAGRRPA